MQKYTKVNRLGDKGKDGTTYLVVDKKGKEYAMKTFKKTKSSKNIEKEYKLLKKAYRAGVAPKPILCDTENKCIVMEKMDSHLYENIKRLTSRQQKRIVEIFKALDKVKVFHNDANLYNYMIKDGEIYLIDYGMSKSINSKLLKKLETDTPNYRLMLLGFIIKMRILGAPKKSYSYLLTHVNPEDMIKYNLG